MKYVNGISSHVYKLNPAFKILYLLFYVTICFLPNNLDYIRIASFIIVSYLLLSSKIPFKYFLNTIYNFKIIIIAMFIILASLHYTFQNSLILVLSFIFGLSLMSLIIFTTTSLEIALGIYNLVKYFNFISINSNLLFFKIYNLVSFKDDYLFCQKNKIEALELKGRNINQKNILIRFIIKIDISSLVYKDVKKLQHKRIYMMTRNHFNIEDYINKLHFFDIIYLLSFILLIGIYILKVM